MRQVNRQVSYVTNILLNEIVLVPHQSFVTFKMVLLDADVAANLVAFGTPWGGGARRTMGLEERGKEKAEPGYGLLGGEMIPWFEGDHDQIVGRNYHEIFDS